MNHSGNGLSERKRCSGEKEENKGLGSKEMMTDGRAEDKVMGDDTIGS